tara:strand:- start:1539 stop:2066 length:528 start_codon:yes stop_codon:yes gene_type:complete
MRPWIAFFSQTGSEIANLSEQLGRWPDVIVVNERKVERVIDSRLQNKKVVFVSNRPTESELINILQWFETPIITLHGWLRIMPPEICETYEIYNGHPGLITTYPELKGKDPQVRAINAGYKVLGCVLHKVSAGVDEGEIILSDSFSSKGLVESDIFRILSETSLKLWSNFLKDKI